MDRLQTLEFPRIALVSILVWLTGWGAGCAHGMDEADRAIEAQNFDRAEQIVEEELDDHSDSPWANQLMAELLVERGNHREALEYADRADESEAFPVRTPRLLGRIHAELGQPVDAADAYHRARQTDPESIDDDIYVETLVDGLTYARVRSDHETRWRLINRLRDVAPEHPEAGDERYATIRRAWAVELRRQGEYLDAVELLESALDDDPRMLRSEALDLGEIYARLQMREDAARAWDHYVEPDEEIDDAEVVQRRLDVADRAAEHELFGIAVDTLTSVPSDIDVGDRRGEILLTTTRYQLLDGQLVEARRTLGEYLEVMTDGADDGEAVPVFFRRAADLAEELDRIRLAITVLEDGVEQARPDRVLTRRLADIYARRAQLDSVEQTLQLYIDRRPDSASAATFAGGWAADRNNYELARRFFEQATERDGVSDDVWLSLAEVLGELDERTAMTRAVDTYMDRRDDIQGGLRAAELYTSFQMYDEAEQLLGRLRDRRPENRTIARQFARLYQVWSRPAEAAEVWSRWAEARGDDPDDLEAAARILVRSGDRERASRFYRRAAEAGNVDAWLDAADIHLRQEHPAAMAEALESYLQAHPDRSSALEDVADLYRLAGMEERYLDALAELVELHPLRWEFYEALTHSLLERGRRAEAFDHLRNYVEKSDDPAEALQRISSPLSTSHPPRWLLDFYRDWEDDPRVQPEITRLIGDAFFALADERDQNDRRAEHLRRRARDHYLEFLDHTEDSELNWQSLANQWRQDEMWRPAAVAFGRHTDETRGGIPSPGYAETMLHLGEIDRAVEMLESYFQSRQRRPEAASRIAELLVDFGLYDRAENYASHLMMAGEDSTIINGFQLMAEAYEQREAYDELPGLVDDFLGRVTNTNRARRTVITLLADLGQSDLMADQLQQFDLSMIYQLAVEMGFRRYRAGRPDGAIEAFEEAADHASRPERVWRSAGEFFEARGDASNAADAYDRAIQANPDAPSIRADRARFRIRRGDLEAGWSDYQFARQAQTEFETVGRVSVFDALASTGHFDRARQVVDDFDEVDGLSTPSELRKTRGRWDLRSPDPDVRNEGIESVRSGSWSTHETMTHIDEVGHRDLLVDLVEEEFREGDATTAAHMLLSRTTAISQLAGWDRQSEWLDGVVDPLQRSDGRLLGPIGDHRARSGQLEDAHLYLRAAVDEADTTYRGQLAHALMLLGERRRAFDEFEAHLHESDRQQAVLESILLRFEIAGAADAALEFLEQITDEPSLIDVSLPYKTHYELERHGDPHRAIEEVVDTIDSLRELPPTAFRSPGPQGGGVVGSRDDLLDRALVGSLQRIAALGYVDAIRTNIDDLDAEQPHRLDELRLRLALAEDDVSGADALVEQMLADVDGARERRELRLRLARLFISFEVDGPARQLVDAALDEQTDFRSHAPFIRSLELDIIAGDGDLLGSIEQYLERVPNRHHARLTLIDELYRLGRDAEALHLASEGSRLRPTADFLRRALRGAIDQGDREQVVEFTDRIFEVAVEPITEIEQVVEPRMEGTEAELLLPIIDRIQSARPADLNWIIERARVLYADGQISPARELLVETLRSRDFQRDAVTEVVQMLDRQNLDVEIARVIAPDTGDDALWPGLLIAFAEAEFALGFEDRALDWLDRLDEFSDHPAPWRLELAGQLADRLLFEAIGPTIEPVEPGESVGPYFEHVRGLHRLATGESQAGLEDVRASNADGVNRQRTHFSAIRAALSSENHGVARELMSDLVEIPVRDVEFVSWPLQIMLAAAIPMDGGPAAVREFLEEHRPRLVDGHGAAWTQFTGQLAQTFEFTGDQQGAYGYYRDRLWQAYFREDDTPLATYFNNLAYTYSTTGRHIERGLDLVRRAIALRDQRSPSFIDTLGWLHYQNGDDEAAEREIRRALRSYEGPPDGLGELLVHLRAILDRRGLYDRAAWIDAHLNRLPPRGLGW